MDRIIVEKSPPLKGTVRISGAKNAALPIMAASLLGTEDIVLEDVPQLKDVEIMCEVLKSLGAEVKQLDPNTLLINSNGLNNYVTGYELMSKMRASFLVMGPLLGRLGKTENALPGGCKIGTRPIDLHLKGFKAMGAETVLADGMVSAHANKLSGATIYLDFPSVGATENIMMAAVLADGETIIENAAMEPEIVDLSNFLRKLGAKVSGAGTSTIRIKGVKKLGGAKHTIIPDRIEAGTFMVAAAITGGDLEILNVIPSHMKPIIAKLGEAGCTIDEDYESLRVIGTPMLNSVDVKTLPYPGFPTDMQAQFMALMTKCNGISIAMETVFENRFMHVEQLQKMGANIQVDGRSAIVNGGKTLHGADVYASDLRAGAALILAGLVAEGETSIYDVYHIDRGYENIIDKFLSLGAKMRRENN
ncbi:MAG: UDP-N-acetylglucosamine 1-carboxyvinyltransferase [Tissierellia bacterium]|nr:UDP-N-acetylglucosamine 1-carboxyvinyltransferase [Tissierellia bacterium]